MNKTIDLKKDEISYREVNINDSQDLFKWRNDKLARKMFRNSERVNFDQHHEWLSERIIDNNCYFLIFSKDGFRKIGYVRFDIKDKFAEISINISPFERGNGYATKCLLLAIKSFQEKYSEVTKLIAEIKTSNIASKKSFQKAGFKVVRDDGEFWQLNQSIY